VLRDVELRKEIIMGICIYCIQILIVVVKTLKGRSPSIAHQTTIDSLESHYNQKRKKKRGKKTKPNINYLLYNT